VLPPLLEPLPEPPLLEPLLDPPLLEPPPSTAVCAGEVDDVQATAAIHADDTHPATNANR